MRERWRTDRRDELVDLGEIARVAAAGTSPLLSLAAILAAGKSRLLAEAAEQAPLSRRFRVLGYEPEREVPLAAASDLLLALAATAGAAHGLESLFFGDDRQEAAAFQRLRIFE